MVAAYFRAYRRILCGNSNRSEQARTMSAGSWLVNW